MTSFLSVDDYEPWRRFLLRELQKQPKLQVSGEASDGLEAVQKAQELQPDLILLDIGLPTLNGIEAARRIRKVSPASKILIVSENRCADIVEAALNDGAFGYVVKSDAASELIAAVDTVLEGKRFLSASLKGHDLMTSHTEASEGEHRIEDNPYLQFAGSALISEFLVSVIEATGADFGNVQLFDSTNHVLRIVAQHGFQDEFLDYFGEVTDNQECTCGAAMNRRSRVIVMDVATDPVFSNEVRGVLLRANVHSLQSTPLIDPNGNVVGLVSTHCSRPERLVPDVLSRVDILAADFLAKLTWVNGRE